MSVLLERIEDIIRRKIHLALETEYQSTCGDPMGDRGSGPP